MLAQKPRQKGGVAVGRVLNPTSVICATAMDGVVLAMQEQLPVIATQLQIPLTRYRY